MRHGDGAFEIDDYTRWRLMEGLDDIGLTLQREEDIAAFEAGPSRLQAENAARPHLTSPRPARPGGASTARPAVVLSRTRTTPAL